MLEKIKNTIPGLFIRNGSYFLRKMVNGHNIQATIGRVSDIELEQAEAQCIELISKVRKQGQFAIDMSTARKSAGLSLVRSNRASTIREIAKDMLAHAEKNGTRKTGSKPWKRSTIKLWNDWINSERMKQIIDQPITNINPQDIEDWYMVDLKKGKTTATDNSFRMLRRLFNWAEGQGINTSDPTRRMALNPYRVTTKRRTRRLDNDVSEIGRFALAFTQWEPLQVKHTNDSVLHILLVALLTGRRAAEIKNMEWDWINFKERVITIPGEDLTADDPLSDFQGTKNREPFVIPMARIIHTMLRHRSENKISDRFVFPQRNRKGPITDFRVSMKHIIELAKVKVITPHDMRRTFADVAYAVRPDFFSQKQAMGHKVNDITLSYMSSLSMVQKRQLFQGISDYVSRSMPVDNLTVNDKQYVFSGKEDLADDNVTIFDDRIFHVDALELMMFKTIWRDGEWIEHGGIEDALPIADLAAGSNSHDKNAVQMLAGK